MELQLQLEGQRHWLNGDGIKDLTTAICILLFAVGGFVFINPEGSAIYDEPGGVTWQTMPFGYASLLLALSLVYILKSIAQIRQDILYPKREVLDAAEVAELKIIRIRRLASLLLLLVYASLLREFGFAVTTPIFLFALFRLYERGHWKGDLAISFVGGFCLWLLFVRVLHLNLKGDFYDPVTPFLFGALKAAGL